MDIERSGTPQVSVCTGNKADLAEHFDSVLDPQPGAEHYIKSLLDINHCICMQCTGSTQYRTFLASV